VLNRRNAGSDARTTPDAVQLQVETHKHLARSGPDLVEHDSKHEDEINPEGPEQDHLSAGELAARAVVLFFGRDELVGFERRHHRGKIFAS